MTRPKPRQTEKRRTGFEDILRDRGFTPKEFSYRLDDVSYSLIQKYAVGDQDITHARYNILLQIAQTLGYNGVDPMMREIKRREESNDLDQHIPRADTMYTLDQIIDEQNKLGQLSEKACTDMCYHARLKRPFTKGGVSTKLAIMKEAAKRLKIEQPLNDWLGREIQ